MVSTTTKTFLDAKCPAKSIRNVVQFFSTNALETQFQEHVPSDQIKFACLKRNLPKMNCIRKISTKTPKNEVINKTKNKRSQRFYSEIRKI